MSSIKDLVKKHFNLVDAPAQSFGEVKTADGELTLAYEGDELAQGLAIFVVTADGQVPAPDGEHALEGGVTIVTADGKIEAIKESEPAEVAEEEAVVESALSEEAMEEEMSPAEAVAEEVIDEVSEEVADVVEEAISEEVVAAVAEAVSESVGEMMKKYEERMASLEAKFEGFASAPAAEKTIAGKTGKFKKEEAPARNSALVERMIAVKTNK